MHPYTKGLLNSLPRLDDVRGEKLRPIEGQPPDLAHMPPGCAFQPRCREAVPGCTAEVPPLVLGAPGHRHACLVAPGGKLEGQKPAAAALSSSPG